MILMPRGPAGRRGGMLQSSAMAMTRDTRARDQAWRLQQWLTDKETGVLFALASKGSLTPGARPDVYADPRFLGRPDLPPGVQETARRAMEEPEPFGLAWNFRGAEVDQAAAGGDGPAGRGGAGPGGRPPAGPGAAHPGRSSTSPAPGPERRPLGARGPPRPCPRPRPRPVRG